MSFEAETREWAAIGWSSTLEHWHVRNASSCKSWGDAWNLMWSEREGDPPYWLTCDVLNHLEHTGARML